MATEKPSPTDDDAVMPAGDDNELDEAIDGLRGVLKADAESSDAEADLDSDAGSTSETEASEAGAAGDKSTAAFGEDFGSDDDATTQSPSAGNGLDANLNLIMDIPIDVEIVLGTSRMQVSGLMNLKEGATIALDRKIGEPVEIMVNGRRIGKGEITVLEGDDTRFGVKLTEIMSTGKA